VRAAREAFEQFAGRATVLTGEHPLTTWLDWLAHLTTEDPWGIAARLYQVPGDEFRLARANVAAWDRLRAVATEWRDALHRWDPDRTILSTAEFHDALRAMLAGDVALHGGPAWGVALLEASAAEYRSFDYVFVAGCDAGRVPRRVPRSPVLDDADRSAFAAAGLPLEQRADWDARERELLRMLVAAARRRLTVSCATLDSAGFEVLPSMLIDALGDAAELRVKRISPSMIITPRLPLYREHTVPLRAHRAARIERVRQGGEISVYNGLIQQPALRARLAIRFGDDCLWSPTQLESYAKCPWAHFSARLLGLEERSDPDADLAILRMREQRDRGKRPNQRREHVRLRVPRIALRAEELVGALAEQQRDGPFDQLVRRPQDRQHDDDRRDLERPRRAVIRPGAGQRQQREQRRECDQQRRRSHRASAAATPASFCRAASR